MQSGNLWNQDATMPPHIRMICYICATWLRPACKHLYFCTRCESKSGPCPSCQNTDTSSSKNTVVPTKMNSRFPPLTDMTETDRLSFILSQQKSIIDKYALDKYNLKAKMEKDMESLWNNYVDDERKRKRKRNNYGIIIQGAVKPDVSMNCFTCGTSLRPVCEHMCLCSPCGNKPQTCPYCLSADGCG